jgi:hypothetical protein
VYLRRGDSRGIKPVAAIPVTMIEAGEISVSSCGLLPLPIVAEVHVYSAKVGRVSVRMLLGSVQPYEATAILGATTY